VTEGRPKDRHVGTSNAVQHPGRGGVSTSFLLKAALAYPASTIALCLCLRRGLRQILRRRFAEPTRIQTAPRPIDTYRISGVSWFGGNSRPGGETSAGVPYDRRGALLDESI
jgi:hypothetical protein